MVEIFAYKLGLNSRRIVMKAQELMRLADIRTMSHGPMALSLSTPCHTIICLDLAASFAKISINKDLAIRLAGVRKKVYLSALQTYEKLLELQTDVTVKDIAVKFGCMQAVDLAQQVLKSYEQEMQKRLSPSVCEGLDLTQPLFAAAAVCAACKKMKIKLDKRKLIEVGRTKKVTFDKLCTDMERHADKLLGSSDWSNKSAKFLIDIVNDNIYHDESVAKKRKISEDNESSVETYEEWKKRILEQADNCEV